TKRVRVDDDLSGPAQARLIQGLEAAKAVVGAITETIDGLRSEKLNPVELPPRFAAIAEQLRQSGETFAQMSQIPIEDVSKAVLQKYRQAAAAKSNRDSKSHRASPRASDEPPECDEKTQKEKARAIRAAHMAINSLQGIGRTNPGRKTALKMVLDWMKK